MAQHSFPSSLYRLSSQVGFISALANTAGGLLYFLAVLAAILTGQFAFPPPGWLQIFGGVTSLIFCPLLVVMMVALHQSEPTDKKTFSQAALGFTLLFALAVSINRFSQLGVVRQASAAGKIEGISWFLAYGDYSIMLGLEYLGWAWFLGLAMLCAAPLFSGDQLESWIRGLMLLYAGLALVSAVGFITGSWISLFGFAAWGVVLFVITVLLAVYFHRALKTT